jgi:rubrerythrin
MENKMENKIENYGETWICNWCEHEAQESEFFTLYGNCPKCKKYQSDKIL